VSTFELAPLLIIPYKENQFPSARKTETLVRGRRARLFVLHAKRNYVIWT